MNSEAYLHLSIDARDLLAKMLTKNPDLRPSIKEIQEHSWF
jgi:serine/threonine protein kinase